MRFLSGEDEIRKAKLTLDAVFSGGSLPEQVFRNVELTDYCWIEFEMMLDSNFWSLAKRCATQAHESYVFVEFVKPYPVDNFSVSGIAMFDASADEHEYDAFLDTADPSNRVISIGNIGETFRITGEHQLWAFWGSRDVELVVGARVAGTSWPHVPTIRYHGFETALELAAGPYRGNLTTKFREQLEANYRSKSSSS